MAFLEECKSNYIRVLNYYNHVFQGRAGRKEFWQFTLVNLVICIAVAILLGIILAAASSSYSSYGGYSHNYSILSSLGGFSLFLFGIILIIAALYGYFIMIPQMVVTAKRLHDTNRSAWWLAGNGLVFIPLIGSILIFIYAIVMIVLLCLPGTEGENRFGVSPYQEEPEEPEE